MKANQEEGHGHPPSSSLKTSSEAAEAPGPAIPRKEKWSTGQSLHTQPHTTQATYYSTQGGRDNIFCNLKGIIIRGKHWWELVNRKVAQKFRTTCMQLRYSGQFSCNLDTQDNLCVTQIFRTNVMYVQLKNSGQTCVQLAILCKYC